MNYDFVPGDIIHSLYILVKSTRWNDMKFVVRHVIDGTLENSHICGAYIIFVINNLLPPLGLGMWLIPFFVLVGTMINLS